MKNDVFIVNKLYEIKRRETMKLQSFIVYYSAGIIIKYYVLCGFNWR